MVEKVNPWLDEGTRYSEEGQGPQTKIREMKFLDNTTHTIRILPSKNPGDFPFHGYKQHWIPQNGSTTAKPVTHGIDERCPVCEWLSVQWNEVHRLKEEEDMTDKSPEVESLLNKISKVSAKTRYDMNILHREDLYVENEETKEKVAAPKRMSAGYTIYTEIFGYAKKWGSPSNEETGYDLEIITSGTKERREYRTIPDRNASPLSNSEKSLIEKCYNLKDLRKNSTIAEIKKLLENAKAPYNEILDFMGENKTRRTKKGKEEETPIEEVEREIEEKVSNQKTEVVKEEQKQELKQDQKQELNQDQKQESQISNESVQNQEPIDDEHNIEVYECKGDFDDNDKMCSDCPVKITCEEIHPYYVKARQLKIDIDPHRLSKEIIDEVKKAEAPQANVSRRGKKIPF